MRLRIFGVVLLSAFCLSASPLRAQDARQEPAGLEPVVVTAGRTAEKPATVTRAVTVIPGEEIEKHHYQDMGDLLRNYGIQVDPYTPNQANSTLAMRGVRSVRDSDLHGGVLVLVDGRRSGVNNISMMPLVNVERIEIIRGPASVQYGSSAVGGVVNIITKRGGEKLKLAAEGGYGSWSTTRALAEASKSFGSFDVSGGVSRLSSDDYRTHSFHRYPDTGVNSLVSYSANAGYSFPEEHRLGVSVHGVDGRRMGSPGDLTGLTPDAYTNENNTSLDLTYDGGLKKAGFAWRARYYTGDRQYQYYDTYDASDPFTSGSYNDRNRTVYQGAQGQLSFAGDFLTLTGGLDWQKNSVWGNNDNGKGSAYFEQERHSSGVYEAFAGFLLAKLSFWEELLIISGGARYDRYAVQAGDSFTPSGSKHFDCAVPSAGVAVNPVKWLTLRGNYGESYQVPTAMQLLGGSWSAYYGRYIGNGDLKPEKGLGWDAGFDARHKSLNMGLTYFSTDYRDKIGTRPVGGDNQYYNVDGTTYYRGIEAHAGYDLGEAFAWPFLLRPYANLTHMLECRGRGQDPDKPDSYATMRNVSDTTLAYGLQFKHPAGGVEADLRATYYGYRKELVYDSSAWTSDLQRRGGETVVDFFAAKTLHQWEGAGALSLKGEVRNLTNVRHEAFAGYPLPGRSFWLGLRYEY